jgi:RNA polymerase sigma-70 factor (ECF subfamily)
VDKYGVALADLFLPHVNGQPAAGDAGALEDALGRLLAAARHAWPALGISDETFLRHAASCVVPSEAGLEAALADLRAADLYLACGCLHGDPAAFAAFEAGFLLPLRAPGALGRSAAPAADDVLQELRARLFVARGAVPPRIATYRGRGPLGAWVRVAAARVAIDLARAAPEPAARAEEAGLRAPADDPELQLLKRRYRPELEAAFRATLAALPARDANVLRLHYIRDLLGRYAALGVPC